SDTLLPYATLFRSPPLGRVWRRRSSEVGIFHSGDFAEYVSGGFVHFTPGDDRLKPHVLAKGGRPVVSRPTRARGLKLALGHQRPSGFKVAPHAGAWIETRRT